MCFLNPLFCAISYKHTPSFLLPKDICQDVSLVKQIQSWETLIIINTLQTSFADLRNYILIWGKICVIQHKNNDNLFCFCVPLSPFFSLIFSPYSPCHTIQVFIFGRRDKYHFTENLPQCLMRIYLSPREWLTILLT